MDINELLARAASRPSLTGKLIVAYGQTGTGKTTTFSRAPKSVLVECKDYSADALKDSGSLPEELPVVKTTGWDDALQTFEALASGGHDFRNVIIDGGSGLHEWSDELTISQDMEGSREKFTAFGRGDRSAGFRWQELMQRLNDMKNAGLWVFLLCHKGTITERNPAGADYYKSVPHLSKEKLAQTLKYADAVLYLDFVIAEKDVNKQSGVGKAVGGDVRVLRCQPSAAYEAKNRLGLPDLIQLGNSPQEGFKAFANAVKAGKKSQQESK